MLLNHQVLRDNAIIIGNIQYFLGINDDPEMITCISAVTLIRMILKQYMQTQN